ncbi:protein phosphatase 1 regulatory subunit 3C-like [Nematolebias whitei]|uniref:protein phosphatase 1 regulatory subunit 3C-like n=1 Tax=Nematolebias whitei TaxID=451745 RepID=UPI00189C3584|nr:protein phosphatase 1 regulatory subunit 3C-like [Nematolebias whitei]
MPVDMAIRICLASSPPLHSFLSNHDNHLYTPASVSPHCQPLRPCLSSECCATVVIATKDATCMSVESSDQVRGKSQKKSVVFADSQGLALTTVHMFSETVDEQLAELKFHLTEIEDNTEKLYLGDNKDSPTSGLGLVLDFTPPAADYLDLRNRLKAQHVSLETCSVQENLLSGTIQVQNICFEKSVLVRITFDSWTSFQDIECRYLNNVYGCPDTDTFAFSVAVPQNLDSSYSVEFCIQYQTEDQTFWDNNLGNNYCLMTVKLNGSSNQLPERSSGLETRRDREKMDEMEFDPLGSPRTSASIFSEWQSWSHFETSAPYW